MSPGIEALPSAQVGTRILSPKSLQSNLGVTGLNLWGSSDSKTWEEMNMDTGSGHMMQGLSKSSLLPWRKHQAERDLLSSCVDGCGTESPVIGFPST